MGEARYGGSVAGKMEAMKVAWGWIQRRGYGNDIDMSWGA